MNLLSNAAKFTKQGTVTVTARREQRQDGDWILFDVTDTGIGIPEDKIDRVFQEFVQTDDSTTKSYGGTGLGMPISQRFCRLMGGDITLVSEVGVGSTFTIALPAEVKSATVSKSAADVTVAAAGHLPDAGHPILVIDDDPDACELLRRTLEADGYAVATAGSGEEGLALARRLRPSLITLDVMMPGLDGWAVLRTLKADPDLKHIPVIMVSMTSDREIGYTLGALESLTKPVDRKQLLKLVGNYARPAGGGRALVVEDDDLVRPLLQQMLQEAGWEVAVAENGAIGLERVAERRPDLILLDLMMPVMDGFEFTYELRQEEDNQGIPIVVITSKDLTHEDRGRLIGGVERIIEKGAFTEEEMLEQVRNMVAKLSNGRAGK
jgi:CheY-like chemotaxis protein